MQKISLLKLFVIFVKIGAILLGGGYVILPILISEFVEKRDLVKEDEVLNYFALSQSLPGIIAANISMFIGYKLRGKLGAIVAMLGIIFVPFLCIAILASFLGTITENIYVKSVLWGVGIAVIALILLTIREIWNKSSRNLFFYLMFVLSLILILVFKFSPIITILIVSIIGILYKKIQALKEAK